METAGTGPQEDGATERLVTADQVAAWNMAYFRRAAGLTQREVEEKLGWKPGRASEAERSWTGGRTREFNAQLLADLAAVLGVPVAALFIPPEDDEARQRYLYPAPGPGEDARPMASLMRDVILGGEDEFSDMLEIYRQRMELAAGRYLDPGWAERLGRILRGEMEPGERADLAAQLRTRAQQLFDASADFIAVAENLDPLLHSGEKDDGQ